MCYASINKEIKSFLFLKSLFDSLFLYVPLQNEKLRKEKKWLFFNHLCKNEQFFVSLLELLKIESPDEYKKESWQMSEKEKLDQIPKLREEGNQFYKENEFDAACQSYSLALSFIEQLMLK